MRKLIATTALALIIGGPAAAQVTDQQTEQQDQDQVQAQDQQQVGQDQQMAGGQGFYQPQPNDLFVSELMDAQVYAPQQRDAQMQQQEPAGQQAATDDAGLDGQQQAGTETTVVETETETETAETEAGADQPEGQVATGDTADEAVQDQQAEMQDDQEELTGTGDQAGTQPGQGTGTEPMAQQQAATGEMRMRQVAQDELDRYENIGQVSDILVDQQGQLRAVVLDVGGFLGIGAREVALDVSQIDFAYDQEDPSQLYIISQVGTDELENAPEFDRQQLEEQRQGDMAATQQQPQDGAVQQEQADAAEAGPDQQVAATPGAQQDGWRGDRQAMAAPQMQREGFQQAEAAEVTADNLIGANVYDVNDENIGSVNDIVMGADGQAEYAVIDVGGFLGFGTHTVAIGFDEMQILHDEGWADLRVYVDVTQEELENMPEYEQN